jgi:hypothetical protein
MRRSIDHPAVVALADDQSEMAQHPQLLRDRGLLHLDLFGEITNRARTSAQTTEDPHPARGRQRLHRLRDRTRGLD